MDYDLTLDIAIKEIESAFKPLKCVIKKGKWEDYISWRVLNTDGKPLFTTQRYLEWQVCNLVQLNSIVSTYRGYLEQKGYELAPWKIRNKHGPDGMK